MDRLQLLADALPPWFAANTRDLPWRRDRNPYHVWISEIMLQQTRVEAVIGYYRRFLEALPTVQALAEVEDDRLMKLWEGLGYYTRARNLKKAAVAIMEDHGGVFPTAWEEIRALPGIGMYTAGAIASICFDQPTPAVDGNVLRVYARFTEDGANIDKEATKRAVAERLRPLYQPGVCGVMTQSLMELGACVCLPNGSPKCEVCPLAASCGAKAHDSFRDYPVRSKKRKRRQVEKTVLILHCDGKYAIRKRGATGLLANLWEFPNGDRPPEKETPPDERQAVRDASALAASLGAPPTRIRMKTTYTHIFTHVEWHMTGYYFDCAAQSPTLTWASAEELRDTYALPSAFRPFLEQL